MKQRSAWLLLASSVLTVDVFAAGADPTYTALRMARPQGPSIAVQDLVLERDVFRFRFEKGAFQFLDAVEGRVTGAVFVGEGAWELHPSGEAERRQLALVTADKRLEVLQDRFTQLVLLFTDGTAAEIEKKGTRSDSVPPQAAGAWDTFLKREHKDLKTNLQLRLLADLLRPPDPARGVFVAFLDGRKLKPGVAVVDPDGLDWMPDVFLVGAENVAFYVMHDTEGGYWYLARALGKPPPTPVARAEHYAIDTTVRKNTDVQGTTTIRFRPTVENLRVLPVRIVDRLRISEAAYSVGDSATWTPVATIQEKKDEDADAAVVFPAALPRGEPVRLRLTYEGSDVLKTAGDGNFVVNARESWYPNLGAFREPAAFELTYRIPKKNQIISVGEPAEDRVDGDNHVAVWKTAAPIRVAGFNYGREFKKVEQTDKDSGLQIQVFTNPGTPDIVTEMGLSGAAPEDLADSAMADGLNTARVGSLYFGRLPEGHVAITQQSQWDFGQSWPSLIFLPYMAFLDSYNRFRIGLHDAESFVHSVGPHEFAHQWWGHLVGWESYHDQWLSEGFAEFTAGLVIELAEGQRKAAEFWSRARKGIFDKPPHAFVANDEAGPITQGWRLATWRNPNAAQAMIYLKGAYVVHMLRMLMRDPKARPQDGAFMAMMQDFVATYSGKNPSTRDFQTVVERHMTPAMDLTRDGKMDWFFRQWVWGMEIPKYVTKLDVRPAGGEQYTISGTVTQDGVSADFHGFLPLYAEFDRGQVLRIAVINFTGTESVPVDTTMKLPAKPKRVFANAFHDVLTRD